MAEAGQFPPHEHTSRPLALVVDDEIELNRLFVAFLENEGFRALSAFTGEEALRLTMACSPAVILLDLMLPYQSGLEIARILKTTPSTARIPILAISSTLEMIPAADARLFAAQIAKPFELETLVAMVRQALSTHTAA